MSDTNKDTTGTTNITLQAHDMKPDSRYLKLEILQLAAELESTAAHASGMTVKIKDVLVTADQLADFVFSEEPASQS